MTAMEDRKKFTYRYDDETEKLLKEGLKKFNLFSLNKLIDKLITDALVRLPEQLEKTEKAAWDIHESLIKCEKEKKQIEIKLNKLKEALKRDIENKEIISKLIQE
jgi:chemotaxis regulatin CheY-phosphate phosphatase CheZ